MTSIVLGTVGTAVGSYYGGPVGGAIGNFIGTAIGTAIDNQIFSNDVRLQPKVGARLSNLAVQSSAYGDMLPILYGTTRIAGNIIWSMPIKETENTVTNTAGGGKGGGGGKVSQNSTYFSYSITLAIAVCEGPIDDILRVWADAKVINPNDGVFRLYKGTETQTPDTLIESIKGVGNVPAYRGIAYVVIEDFPLADYGNRIPNFTFEVKKSALTPDDAYEPVEELIKSMVMIPGSGEFVYDDTVQLKIPGELIGGEWAQEGASGRINQNNRNGKADALVALDQLESICPNLEWVAVVAGWFGDSLDAGTCIIQPGVEFKIGKITEPDSWAVAGYDRDSARQITLIDDAPRYGGTPSDASLLRYIQEIKNRGYNVMFYPIFFMDVEDKPWRGRVTGSATDVADFFTKTDGYNTFVNHYANLVKDDVDAFVIGSELVGLTKIQALDNSFPAVDALVLLAADVKAVVSAGVKVTYAADWSEYHHDANGWYNLDPLWSSPDIDIIGIDAYFPLTDEEEPASGFTQEVLRSGWTAGEGYDWYYSDVDRTVQTALSPEYAWKNIAWWWTHSHVNPDSTTTAWTPSSKKIWFTEFGYPSVDGASNQPNVFIDPDSGESAYPYHSRGRTDFRAQKNALKATLEQWKNSTMIERMFVWTWDARPFPFWPDLTDVWADGGLWKTGHWVNGKLGTSSLAAIVSDLSQRAGLDASQIDVTRLSNLVDGFVINGQTTSRSAIDALRKAYFFDAVESDGAVKYVARGGGVAATIDRDNLIPSGNQNERDTLSIVRKQELELPQKIDVVYINKDADYQQGNQHSERSVTNSVGVETLGLPIVMTNQSAKVVADVTLYNDWIGRTSYSFNLPIEYAKIEPTDIVTVTIGDAIHKIRVTSTHFGTPGIIKITGIAEDVTAYDFYREPGNIPSQTGVVTDPGDTVLALLDLPAFPTDNANQGYLRYAVSGKEAAWKGSVVFRSDDDGENYSQILSIAATAASGVALTALSDGVTDIFDEENSVDVSILGNAQLEGVSELAVLNGANLAKIGDEIIQFKFATLISDGKYTLSGLLRGRLGTEWAASTHETGEDFVLLDNNIAKELMPNSVIGIARLYKGVSVGHSLADTDSEAFTYTAQALKPYSPVHITGTRDGDDLTINWIRRTRINGGWQDNVDVSLGEESEAYEVDILDGSMVVRTITVTSPTASYTAAQQTDDFGAQQASVDVVVYQLSAIVGRGEGGEGTV
jgi:hypothetical protein